MTLNSPHDSAVFNLPGVTFTTCASPSRGSQENSVWKVRIAPGTKPHLHRVTREEIFVAVKGAGSALVAGKPLAVTAGATLVVPANTEFGLGNDSDGDFEAIVVLPVGGAAIDGDAGPFVPPWAA